MCRFGPGTAKGPAARRNRRRNSECHPAAAEASRFCPVRTSEQFFVRCREAAEALLFNDFFDRLHEVRRFLRRGQFGSLLVSLLALAIFKQRHALHRLIHNVPKRFQANFLGGFRPAFAAWLPFSSWRRLCQLFLLCRFLGFRRFKPRHATPCDSELYEPSLNYFQRRGEYVRVAASTSGLGRAAVSSPYDNRSANRLLALPLAGENRRREPEKPRSLPRCPIAGTGKRLYRQAVHGRAPRAELQSGSGCIDSSFRPGRRCPWRRRAPSGSDVLGPSPGVFGRGRLSARPQQPAGFRWLRPAWQRFHRPAPAATRRTGDTSRVDTSRSPCRLRNSRSVGRPATAVPRASRNSIPCGFGHVEAQAQLFVEFHGSLFEVRNAERGVPRPEFPARPRPAAAQCGRHAL